MIPVAEPELSGNELKYVTDAVKSSWISSSGKYIKKFEKGFAKFCGTKHAVSCNNGTSSLHLALLALGIGKGDEVIIPVSTYIATANAVRYVGAIPIFIDSNQRDWGIDAKRIHEKITSRTKAIIAVHLYGIPCEMDKIIGVAKEFEIPVIEDAAEAHGAEYKGRKVGSMGDIGCFSFFGNKIITTGEGGMCVTNNKKLKEKLELFRNQGTDGVKPYWHTVIGYNYRMTNVQAAIGLAQLEQIETFLKKREENAEIYRNNLKYLKASVFIPEFKDRKIVYWSYILLTNDKDKIVKKLKEKGVDTRPFFYPLVSLPPYKSEDKYPIAKMLHDWGIHLPSSTKLKKKEIEMICEVIKEVKGNGK